MFPYFGSTLVCSAIWILQTNCFFSKYCEEFGGITADIIQAEMEPHKIYSSGKH